MTTDDKEKYIQMMMKLVTGAESYERARDHASFVRGILSAWNADGSISIESFTQYCTDLELYMGVKRNLKAGV